MHPPVAMVSGASCIFTSYLSFSGISFVKHTSGSLFWTELWGPEGLLDISPATFGHLNLTLHLLSTTVNYIFSTVVDAEIRCWNGKFHIRTTLSEAEYKIHWPLSKTHTWACHAPLFLCHKIHEKQHRAEWLLPPSKLLHRMSLIQILQWVKPSFCPKNFLH